MPDCGNPRFQNTDTPVAVHPWNMSCRTPPHTDCRKIPCHNRSEDTAYRLLNVFHNKDGATAKDIHDLIVFVHELGHFIAAKKSGVHVYEFAIGMGPKIFSFKRKNDPTIYSLRLLPLGGFNAIASTMETCEGVKESEVLENKSFFCNSYINLASKLFEEI